MPRFPLTSASFNQAEFDAFLTDISESFLQRDLNRWRARLLLPFSMVTATGPVTLTTDDEVAQNFALYLQAKDAMGLDLVDRDPLGWEVCHDGTILATYRTNLLHQGQRIVPAYTSSALLQRKERRWKASAILNALGHHHWTGQPPIPKTEKDT